MAAFLNNNHLGGFTQNEGKIDDTDKVTIFKTTTRSVTPRDLGGRGEGGADINICSRSNLWGGVERQGHKINLYQVYGTHSGGRSRSLAQEAADSTKGCNCVDRSMTDEGSPNYRRNTSTMYNPL